MKKDPNSERFYLWLNQTPIEEHLQPYKEICKGYGLADPSEVERLAKHGFYVFLYFHHLQYEKADLEDFQFIKDLATLTSIFKDGENIIIKASMPDGVRKFEIETEGLLQQLAFFTFNALLGNMGRENADLLEYLPFVDYSSTIKFKKPYTDKELADIIEYQSSRIEEEKAMMGRKERTKTEIPKLGSMVHGFIEAGGDGLAALTPTEKYCLIGDMMLAANVSPVEQVEWESILTNKDKADKVKSWEASYLKVIGK